MNEKSHSPDRKKGRFSLSDLALWKAFTRDIAPLRAGPPEDGTDSSSGLDQSPIPVSPRAGAVPLQRPSAAVKPSASQPPQLDRRTREKLERGKMPIEARLDLHGYTQDQARTALVQFVTGAQALGKRCVLVITGTGKFGDRYKEKDKEDREIGVLRRRVPEWLAESPLAPLVLSVVPARRRDGGDGAFYVYLKRDRD